MRLGSAKDVKMLFSHFAAALAFRCILLIQDAARQCPFLHCRAVACAFLSRPPVETQNLASPDWHGIPSLSVSCMSIHQPSSSRDAKSCVSTFVRQRWLLMACVQALRYLELGNAAEVYCNICCAIVLIWCGVVFFDVFYLC